MAIEVHLEDVLKERGMTSKELCKLVGITEANLSILRSGKAKGVRFGTINRICYFLNCDVGDILRFDGELEEEDEEQEAENSVPVRAASDTANDADPSLRLSTCH